MAETIEVPVRLEVDRNASQGVMRVLRYRAAERRMRALGLLFGLWLAAAISIFIPVAHFFLVPGLFVAGIVMAWRAYRREEEGIDVRGKCPNCEDEIVLALEKERALPLWRRCPKCNASVGIQQTS